MLKSMANLQKNFKYISTQLNKPHKKTDFKIINKNHKLT